MFFFFNGKILVKIIEKNDDLRNFSKSQNPKLLHSLSLQNLLILHNTQVSRNTYIYKAIALSYSKVQPLTYSYCCYCHCSYSFLILHDLSPLIFFRLCTHSLSKESEPSSSPNVSFLTLHFYWRLFFFFLLWKNPQKFLQLFFYLCGLNVLLLLLFTAQLYIHFH